MKRLTLIITLIIVVLLGISMLSAAASKKAVHKTTPDISVQADSQFQTAPVVIDSQVVPPSAEPEDILPSDSTTPDADKNQSFSWHDFWNTLENPVNALLKALLTYLSAVVGFNLLIFLPIISELLNLFRKNKKQIDAGKLTQDQAFENTVYQIKNQYPSKVSLINKRFGSVEGLVEFAYRRIFKK